MGAQCSNLNEIKKNEYLKRLVDEETINENDPFWNQLLSFAISLPLTKSNSQLLDESVALHCQQFLHNNLKTGNYGALIRVFCRLSTEIRQMSDNHLMILQTSNALLLIRCFTKYIIEIENETSLLEQINSTSIKENDINQVPNSINDNNNESNNDSNNKSTSSILINDTEKNFSRKNSATAATSVHSQDDLNENDSSEAGSVTINEFIKNKNNESETLIQLITSLFELCIQVPIEAHTYVLHLEVLNNLIVLLSVQMYTKLPTHELFIYETFMVKMDQYVSDFIKCLLKNVIQQMPIPHGTSSAGLNSQKSLISSVASGLWSVMTLGYGSSGSPQPPVTLTTSNQSLLTYLPNLPNDNDNSSSNLNDTQIDCENRLLAWQSCHVLLILSNHCSNESLCNPYRLALFHFTDTQNTPTNLPNSEPLPWLSVDYSKLFQMFTFTLHTDQYTLLLYMLLHRNQHFKMFILSRLNIDLLIIPILKVIYTAPDRNSHHIYMALIILLMLSEDDIFNKTVHNLPIKRLSWYTERSLSEISLGGLLILVIIRTIQFNMTRMRDKYLHTNCLAALANMSSKFYNLHPYVCQRLNSLFNLLAKKRTKIINLLNVDNNDKAIKNNEATDDNNGKDLMQDLSIIEELMRMVLEIINSCITNNIHHNSNLIYSILYHKNLFVQFHSHPTFQDVIQNIDIVINSFSHDIENIEDKSIENLKSLIELGVKQFSRDRFKKFPELKFKYVEEDQPEEFFVPYVWSLVYKFSNLFWIDHSIKQFYSAAEPNTKAEINN